MCQHEAWEKAADITAVGKIATRRELGIQDSVLDLFGPSCVGAHGNERGYSQIQDMLSPQQVMIPLFCQHE